MEENIRKDIIPGMFLTYLSTISSYLKPKGSPHSPGVTQHGLNGQQQCTRIDRTFGLFWIHGFLDPSLKETTQVSTYELIILQTIRRNPMKKSKQQYIHAPALYSTFCWPPQSCGAGDLQTYHSQQSNTQTSGKHRRRMGMGRSLNPSSSQIVER